MGNRLNRVWVMEKGESSMQNKENGEGTKQKVMGVEVKDMEEDKETKSKEVIDKGKADQQAESSMVITNQFTVLELAEDSRCLELEGNKNMKANPSIGGDTLAKPGNGGASTFIKTCKERARGWKVASSYEKSVANEFLGVTDTDWDICNTNRGKELMKGQPMGKAINVR
ncbi:unnamed protein product [Dovyalis caffra]|uniref:Uncharacterized protein n=1 Tax=Dovyalis caffra TaxID=77055 RepID=A0AAV1SHD5_9ROSI|nr:unnamed protein product [Dovyalis caffra]